MDKLEEDWKRIEIVGFWKLISLTVYLLEKKLWFCRLQVISSLTLSSIVHKEA